MILVKQIEGAWTPVRGVVTLARAGGATDRLDMDTVAHLVREGIWGEHDLAAYGLASATAFVAPEGKRATGEPRYEEQPDGTIVETFDAEDIPPLPIRTTEQKLAAAGLTLDEIDELVAGSLARQGR